MKRIAVLITSHNRKRKTLTCLKALYENNIPNGFVFDVYLVDDGSTDGTYEAVRQEFPQVNLIKGDGNLFWNQGMRLAWETAANAYDYDFYFWLNDDTILSKNAIATLIESYNKAIISINTDSIIVGATKDLKTNKMTYGGRIKKNKFDFFASVLIIPTDQIQKINTFNGNIVLIPKKVFKQIGFLDNRYVHAMGDVDYGLVADKKNISIYLSPYYLGFCSIDKIYENWTNPGVPFKKRWILLNSKKGLPLKQWKIYTKKHAGIFWPVFYFKVLLRVCCPILWRIK